MNKVLSLLLLTCALSIFVACEKPRGDASACIDTGTSSFKAANVVHFMNCSKNYDFTRWVVADAAMVPIYTAPTDTVKHFKYSFTPGNYNVILHVWQSDSVSVSQATKSFTIVP